MSKDNATPRECPHEAILAPLSEDGTPQPGKCLACGAENVMVKEPNPTPEDFEQFLEDYQLIESKPGVMGGEPVIRGTRVLAKQLRLAHQADLVRRLEKLKNHECALNDGDTIAHECIEAAIKEAQG